MEAGPGRRFLKQPAAKLELVIVVSTTTPTTVTSSASSKICCHGIATQQTPIVKQFAPAFRNLPRQSKKRI